MNPVHPISHSQIESIVNVQHADPHTLLGAHPIALDGHRTGIAVRTFRPEAVSVRVVPEDTPLGAQEAHRLHDAGLFEAIFPDATHAFQYRIEVEYAGGTRFTLRDPYAFWPTLGEMDVYLAAEGKHRRIYDKLGAHASVIDGVPGVAFAVWAPAARRVSVVGNFNGWDGRLHPMRRLAQNGIWELFVPDIGEGAVYKFEVVGADGERLLKLDPYAFRTELRPDTAGVVHAVRQYPWTDAGWLAARADGNVVRKPWSIYEAHLGGFMRVPEEWGPGAEPEGNGHTGRWLTYRELAHRLVDYVKEMGFTHVELMPITEYPFDGSWGYQVTGYFAPTSRHGSPEDLRYLIDRLHAAGVGVILDWVPGHFPRDAHGLRRFDGTAVYEHLDPRQGEHREWGTHVFNYGRAEVRNFLIASALYWLREYHFDGLRVDAVASMLYLDYSRKEGEWVANQHGGRENIEAISFMRELNEVVHGEHPGAVVVAEESTAWAGVSRPVFVGGLGFTLKWNMGWMHDTLAYFSLDPVFRRYHHNQLTFGMLYAWSENFVLPLSHDEVVHGKGSLLGKMPGDRWQRFANLRALFGYMWAHPGKKLLFMGGEFAQDREFFEGRSLDWHLLEQPEHAGVQHLVRDLNARYRESPALWEADVDPAGFRWIDANDSDQSVVSFIRFGHRGDSESFVVCVLNATPVPRSWYRIGVPRLGRYHEIMNTDASAYGGSGMGNLGGVHADDIGSHGFPHSISLTVPPLAVLWLRWLP